MKNIILIVVLFGSLNFAQAVTQPNQSDAIFANTTLEGNDAYEVGVSVPVNEQITSATITFQNVTLTLSGNSQNTGILYVDLINQNLTGTTTYVDNDAPGNYFTSTSFLKGANKNVSVIQIGSEFFSSVGTTINGSITFTGAALTALLADAADGKFDIGLDPDCHFTIGSISFSYSTSKVPDVASTAGLLGISFLGLVAFRRKFIIRSKN